ncbi:helix-turn-helix transcriptional regulator [Glutamicibacter ardleyensis]|uniref:helix-turn-helix transcriptional regulator n=1 Tax=Glutamicibacter ardleyensis TaxID=225894 RepID=UPI003FD2E94B
MAAQENTKDSSQVAIKFGKNLKFFREKLGMTQTDLANSMKSKGWKTYSQVGVARTETGSRMVRLDEALALASCLERGVDDLLDTRSAKTGLYEKAVASYREMRGTLEDMNSLGWKYGELRERLQSDCEEFSKFQGDMSEDMGRIAVVKAEISHFQSFATLSANDAMAIMAISGQLNDKAGNSVQAFPFDGNYPISQRFTFEQDSSSGND